MQAKRPQGRNTPWPGQFDLENQRRGETQHWHDDSLEGPRGTSGNEAGRPRRWLGLRVRACARTHTHTHTHGWRAAPLSGAQREPNLEPRDPAPPPPASQPATSQKSTMHGNQAKDSFPNGAHLLQTPLQLRTRSALRAPACRNTPRLSARGCHRFLLLFPPTCSPHPD